MSDSSLLREFDCPTELQADELGEMAFSGDYEADFDEDHD